MLQAQAHAAELTAERKTSLAEHLGLPVNCLDSIQYLGSRKDSREGLCWTFPEQDGDGAIIGLVRRRADGKKRALKGSQRGLTVQRDWEEREGPIYVPEGASCTLALGAMGLAAIGRPSNTGGAAHLARMLGNVPATRPIIVLGEWDAKSDGSWPGLEGAKQVAAELSEALSRPVSWALPPDHAKDVRAWVCTRMPGPCTPEEWQAAAERFARTLETEQVSPTKEKEEEPGLSLRSFDQIQEGVLRWAVPAYFPAGQLAMISGDGGEGKSLVTIHLASAMTRGQPAFNLTYTTPGPQRVVLMACEDDASSTLKPRLLAADADLSRVFLVDGVRDKKGKLLPFSLAHIDRIAVTLERLKDVGLVLIDPVSAYLGGTNVNPGRDDEVRTLLEPLRLLGTRFNTLILMVKHFNKSTGPVARSRIADAAGWRNAARASYLVLPDPGNELHKLLLPDKLNGAPLPPGLCYQVRLANAKRTMDILQGLPKSWSDVDCRDFARQLAMVEFLGETDYDANSVCAEQAMMQQENPERFEEAVVWLKRYLEQMPLPADECSKDGNAVLNMNRPTKWWRDRILKGRLSGTSVKEPVFQGVWYFCLPGQKPAGM